MRSLKQTAAVAAMMVLCALAAHVGVVWAEDAKPQEAATTQPAAAQAGEPAVTVNGEVVTEADVDETFTAGLQGQNVPAAQLPMLKQRYRQQIVEMLIDDKLFEVQAKKENVSVSEEELAKKIEGDLEDYAKTNNITKEDLSKQVEERMGMSLKEYVAQRATNPFLRRMLCRAKLIEKKFPDAVKVSEDEIKEHYDQNLESTYQQAAKVRASHILFGTRDKSDEEKAEARKKAEEVLAQLKKPDADFAALAQEHSDCPSKNNGGDLNFFPREGAMVEPFAKAAFDLKEGEISDIVETQFGYHIIKVTDRQEASTTSLAEATDSIREHLHRQKISKQMQEYTAELRKDAKIVYPEGKEPATQPAGLGMMRPNAPRPAAANP